MNTMQVHLFIISLCMGSCVVNGFFLDGIKDYWNNLYSWAVAEPAGCASCTHSAAKSYFANLQLVIPRCADEEIQKFDQLDDDSSFHNDCKDSSPNEYEQTNKILNQSGNEILEIFTRCLKSDYTNEKKIELTAHNEKFEAERQRCEEPDFLQESYQHFASLVLHGPPSQEDTLSIQDSSNAEQQSTNPVDSTTETNNLPAVYTSEATADIPIEDSSIPKLGEPQSMNIPDSGLEDNLTIEAELQSQSTTQPLDSSDVELKDAQSTTTFAPLTPNDTFGQSELDVAPTSDDSDDTLSVGAESGLPSNSNDPSLKTSNPAKINAPLLASSESFIEETPQPTFSNNPSASHSESGGLPDLTTLKSYEIPNSTSSQQSVIPAMPEMTTLTSDDLAESVSKNDVGQESQAPSEVKSEFTEASPTDHESSTTSLNTSSNDSAVSDVEDKTFDEPLSPLQYQSEPKLTAPLQSDQANSTPIDAPSASSTAPAPFQPNAASTNENKPQPILSTSKDQLNSISNNESLSQPDSQFDPVKPSDEPSELADQITPVHSTPPVIKSTSEEPSAMQDNSTSNHPKLNNVEPTAEDATNGDKNSTMEDQLASVSNNKSLSQQDSQSDPVKQSDEPSELADQITSAQSTPPVIESTSEELSTMQDNSSSNHPKLNNVQPTAEDAANDDKNATMKDQLASVSNNKSLSQQDSQSDPIKPSDESSELADQITPAQSTPPVINSSTTEEPSAMQDNSWSNHPKLNNVQPTADDAANDDKNATMKDQLASVSNNESLSQQDSQSDPVKLSDESSELPDQITPAQSTPPVIDSSTSEKLSATQDNSSLKYNPKLINVQSTAENATNEDKTTTRKLDGN